MKLRLVNLSTGCPAHVIAIVIHSEPALPFGVDHRRNNPLFPSVSESYRSEKSFERFLEPILL